MKIIYFLLIFGIIYSSTNLPDKVVDIYYNVEYALSKDLSRQFTYYPFRLPVIAGDKMDIEQAKAEINLRYQMLNSFSYKSPNINYYEKNKFILFEKPKNEDVKINNNFQ